MPPSLEEVSGKYGCGRPAAAPSSPEQDSPERWRQLEQWVADLQAEVVALRGHQGRCERVLRGLLRELLQVRARLQGQDAELRALQQEAQWAAQGPEREAPELPSPQNQMQTLDKRLVEVREALTQIRRKQALQDSERKAAQQEAAHRLAKLMEQLQQEEQDRAVACGDLQKGQEAANLRVDHEVARMQARVTRLGEEMSLRFLRREAKLCGFLQKSFLALEKRMKAAEGSRLRAESSLRAELDGRWQELRELDGERARALRAQCEQEERRLAEQCRGLDEAVIQLTTFVRQNQLSLNQALVAQQEAWDAKGHLEESQAEELTAYLRENLEAAQLAGEQAQRETHHALELLREKSQALEASVAKLGGQVKELSDHFLALSWRLDLQEQTLSLRLDEAKSEWEGAGQTWLQSLALCRQEAEARARELRDRVDSLPRQMEALADKCALHKSSADLQVSAEGKARQLEVGAVRQELAALLSSVQLLREDQPGRKIAEIQGKLATFQNQIMKLENSLQDQQAIRSLKFNTESKLVAVAEGAAPEAGRQAEAQSRPGEAPPRPAA